MAFSPDGSRIAAGATDKAIKVWDAESGTEKLDLIGHKAAVSSVAFSPDGSQISSGSLDHTVRVWNSFTGAQKRCLIGHERKVNSVAFCPDGKRLASASDDCTIKMWSLATVGTEILTMTDQKPVKNLAFSPDGRSIAASTEKYMKIRDVDSGQLRIQEQDDVSPHEFGLAYSSDGSTLGSCSRRSIKVWDSKTGKVRTEIDFNENGGGSSLNCAAYSPDGICFATGLNGRVLDNKVKIWDMSTGKEHASLLINDKNLVDRGFCWSVSFSPNGAYIGANLKGGVGIWKTSTGELTATLATTTSPSCLRFSPDGSRIALYNGRIEVWDIKRACSIAKMTGDYGSVNILAFSPDGTRIASGGYDGTVKVWDVATGAERASLSEHSAPVNGVAFSPDGSLIASCSDDGTIKIWKGKNDESPEEALRFLRAVAAFDRDYAQRNFEKSNDEYAKQFWRSQLLIHDPFDIALWGELDAAKNDPARLRLFESTCNALAGGDPNAAAFVTRQIEIARSKVKVPNPEPLPMPRVVP